MATIINHSYRTTQVKNGIDRYGRIDQTTSLPYNNLYMLYGNNTPWASGDTNPPLLSDTQDEVSSAWADALAIVRVDAVDIAPVVARKTWMSGNVYVVFDTASVNAYTSDFYVINSLNQVFRCNVTPSTASTVEPIYAAGTKLYAEADGYTWEYLYSVSLADANAFLTNTYMPVNYGSSIDAAQIADGDVNAVDTLYASDLMIYKLIDGADASIPVATFNEYRKVALVEDPLVDATAATPVKLVVVSELVAAGAASSRDTGQMLYMENRTPIYRDIAQSSEVRVVLVY